MYPAASTSSPARTSSPSTGPSVTPARLGYFCIYNPDFGPTDETQHEQLLYYCARKTVSMDVKMRNIGLAQGLVNFARIFSPTAPCENVHSQKNRLVFYEAEPGYWLNLSIELGTTKRSVKGVDGKQRLLTEYQEHEVHDTVVSALLRQAYGMYRVAHGTMDSLVQAHDGNTRPLQRRLEEFFEGWVLGWDFEKAMNLERALDGIYYLPLSRSSYLAVERLTKAVKEKYGAEVLTHSMVTFEDQLVSSDIRDGDLREVWKQVVQSTGYDGATAANAAAGDRKEEEDARKKKSTFKFGKSWSNTSIFGFYRSSSSSASTPPSTPPLRPISRVSSPAPSIRSVDGVMGTISANNNNNNNGGSNYQTLGAGSSSLAAVAAAAGAGSSPRPSGESDSPSLSGGKVQVNPMWFGEFIASEDVIEHYGIIFKHKSGLNLSFFTPAQGDVAQKLMDEPEQFSKELEEFLASMQIHDSTTTPLLEVNSVPVSVGGGQVVGGAAAAASAAATAASRSQLEDVARQVIKDAMTARGLGGAVASDKEVRFLYFNRMNLAIKAQLGSTTGKGGAVLGSDVALALLDIKQDFDRMPDATEITTRSPLNHWIVGKRLEDREVYMIVSRKDSTLVEVEDEVRKLASLYFNSNPLSAQAILPASLASTLDS